MSSKIWIADHRTGKTSVQVRVHVSIKVGLGFVRINICSLYVPQTCKSAVHSKAALLFYLATAIHAAIKYETIQTGQTKQKSDIRCLLQPG